MAKRGKFFYLLISILFILVVYPFITPEMWFAGTLFSVFFTAVLVSGVYAVSEDNRRKFAISLILSIPAVALLWLDQFVVNKIIDELFFIFMSLFCFFTFFCIISHIMRSKRVTLDLLAGAVCGYLLLGISWGMLYSFLKLVIPGSFVFSETIRASSIKDWPIFIYYSFTTLTTLGYGDITPVDPRTQSFAFLEAVTGVLYIAILIARLIGMYLYHAREGSDRS